ncbi:putative RNA-directed RNA polymerase [Dioscorea sansibarensis]
MDGKTIKIYGWPNTVTATEVKEFLEKSVSKGSVVAIKVRGQEDSDGSSKKAFAVVQFLISKHVRKVSGGARQGRLKYRTFALTTKTAERDIVPEPRIPLFTWEDATLFLGCPISSEEFSVLCRFNNVRVDFGANLRKICFFISSGNQSYKLELSYESIWEIKLLRCHKGRKFHKGKKSEEGKKFLLVQVQAAPRIYEVPGQNSGTLYEDARFNYFKDIPDDQWIRTTDFTPSRSIGQSSAFCLQLPYDCSLPNIREYFVYYEEVDHPFRLLKGSSFSHSLDLVPIVEPSSPGIEVPYRLLFKINHMVQNGTLMGPTLDDKFYKLVSPHSELPINYIERALEDMSYLKSSCLNPATWLQEKYQEFHASNESRNHP